MRIRHILQISEWYGSILHALAICSLCLKTYPTNPNDQTVNQYTGSSNNAKSKCLMSSLLDNFLWTKNCNYWRIHCTLKNLLSSISINRSPFTIKMPVCNHLIYLIRTDCLCIFFQKNAPPKLLQSFKSFFKKVKRD